MLIYLDLIFILNYWIDFLLLIATNIILKKKVNIIRVLIASFVGALTTFTVFIDNYSVLVIIKIVVCIIMQLIANKVTSIKSILENSFYFYLVSIILAGSLYLFKLDKLSVKYNYLLLFITTPIILYINKKQISKIDTYYKDRYDVYLYYKNKKYLFNAFLDTGNKLYDQYKKRPIILIHSNKIKFNYNDGLLVPIETVNSKSVLKCIKADKIIIDGKEIKNVIVGLSDKEFKIEDINMILHKDIMGGIRW